MPDTCVDSIGKTCVEASAMSISKFRSPASTTSLRQWSGVAWRRDKKLSHLLGTWLWRCCRYSAGYIFLCSSHPICTDRRQLLSSWPGFCSLVGSVRNLTEVPTPESKPLIPSQPQYQKRYGCSVPQIKKREIISKNLKSHPEVIFKTSQNGKVTNPWQTLRMLIREEILDHLENIDSIDLGARWNFFQ